LNDKEKAFENLLMSEKYIDKMYTDLPKKIKNLTKVYKMYHELNKEEKKKEIEKKIYLIINNDFNESTPILERGNLLCMGFGEQEFSWRLRQRVAKLQSH